MNFQITLTATTPLGTIQALQKEFMRQLEIKKAQEPQTKTRWVTARYNGEVNQLKAIIDFLNHIVVMPASPEEPAHSSKAVDAV